MRKIIAIASCLMLLCCMLSACQKANKVTPDADGQNLSGDLDHDPVNEGKTLKVLAIGNSFSVDTMNYLCEVAKAEGIETVVLGNLYISGCTLKTHCENAAGNLNAYKYYINYGDGWSTIDGCSLEYALKSEEWDFITMQQGSRYSGQPDSYENYLTELIEYVNLNKTNPKAKLVWHMTWAYQTGFEKSMFSPYNYDQMTMYNAIVNSVQSKVIPHSEISFVIPTGTVLQNIRTSYIGDNLNRDGYHLNDLGRLIGSYTWLTALRGAPLNAISIDKLGNSGILTDTDKAVIMDAVNAAFESQFTVTQSAYTEGPTA